MESAYYLYVGHKNLPRALAKAGFPVRVCRVVHVCRDSVREEDGACLILPGDGPTVELMARGLRDMETDHACEFCDLTRAEAHSLADFANQILDGFALEEEKNYVSPADKTGASVVGSTCDSAGPAEADTLLGDCRRLAARMRAEASSPPGPDSKAALALADRLDKFARDVTWSRWRDEDR